MPAIGLSVRKVTPRRFDLSGAQGVTGPAGGPIADHMDAGGCREHSTTSLPRRIRLHILEIGYHTAAAGRRAVEDGECERRLPFLRAACLFPIRRPSLLRRGASLLLSRSSLLMSRSPRLMRRSCLIGEGRT
jgi:hypothetical protein